MKSLASAAMATLAVFALAQGYTKSQGTVDKAGMTRLTSQQKAAEAAFKKNPKSPVAKKAYIDANNRHGLACMTTDALDRKLKYRMAIKSFAKTLKVEPKNKIARENTDLIVSIYKSMGRPVPG